MRARPIAQPTPQGGGIAVVVATFVVAWGAVAMSPALLQNEGGQFLALTATAALLAVVGAIDDMRSLPAAMRLAMQCIAVGALIAALPDQLRVLPQVPWWLERAGLFVGGVWFVNLVNFMDGIDWMTVAELVPVTGAIVLLGLAGAIGLMALGGRRRAARRDARLCALQQAGRDACFSATSAACRSVSCSAGSCCGLPRDGHLAAAVILPLYYLADATITLIRRVVTARAVLAGPSQHFYQRATDNGFTVPAIVARVVLVNVALAALGGHHGRGARRLPCRWPRWQRRSRSVAWLLLTFARASAVKRSGRFAAEIRHRVAQHAEDHGAVLAREPLLQRREPAAHRLERRTDRLGGDDAFDADRRGRLLAREQDFVQALARPDAGEGDVDVAAGLEPGQPDHPLGEIDDLHRLAHVEDVDRDARMLRPRARGSRP